MIIIINYLCHHYCYWHVCWLWLGLLALRPSVLSFFFFECDIFFYYKARQELLQSATAFSLQCTTRVITKCDSFFLTKYDVCYYKVWQLFFITGCDFISLESCEKMLWQSATGITKCDSFLSKSCDNFITKCDRYCKMRQVL